MIYPNFVGEPEFKLHPYKPKFLVTTNEFIFYLNADDFCVIPPGSIWNGASIPLFLQTIFPAINPRYNKASVFHDPACGEAQEPIKAYIDGEERVLTWKESAEWFREAMKCCSRKTKPWQRGLFYEAVMLKKRPLRWLRIIKEKII